MVILLDQLFDLRSYRHKAAHPMNHALLLQLVKVLYQIVARQDNEVLDVGRPRKFIVHGIFFNRTQYLVKQL
jgi:hypothetical protein